MEHARYQLEARKAFSESYIWKLNKDFYQESGVAAWSDNIVPHHMTSNSMVGKTYAQLILAVLKDLAAQGKVVEKVYILELGAGHGRLAFHVLQHLQALIEQTKTILPPYCYILSDFGEENLTFFTSHGQFEDFFKQGILDVAYFDAIESTSLELRIAKKSIQIQELSQPIIAIGNYFFDSIPSELLSVKDNKISSCSIEIHSTQDPQESNYIPQFTDLSFTYFNSQSTLPLYHDKALDVIVDEYKNALEHSHFFFPKNSINCIRNVKNLSQEGLVLLSIDKGFHELTKLDNRPEPEIIGHGSCFSIWVNFHCLGLYCENEGGRARFPRRSNFHMEVACLSFLKNHKLFTHTNAAYDQYVDDFGPDDFNSIKQLSYNNLANIKTVELLALIRLSAYDSGLFYNTLPLIKQVISSITMEERRRIAEMLELVWKMYFNIDEHFDLAYEIGGLYYDLGFYNRAYNFFQYSVDYYGIKADIFYNQALCLYQLKQDKLFYQVLASAKRNFPNDTMIQSLEKLDMS